MEPLTLEVIAHIKSDFPTKFGIPRQSGLAETQARVVFTPAYRNADALRGLEDFSHIWLIWGFSEARRAQWSPTVRPPRLGGNARMGVFATRSPYRPNPLALSCVELAGIEQSGQGAVLLVRGADLMDGTPIYDIKPYLPYTDCRSDATGGFAAQAPQARLQVEFAEELLERIPQEKRAALLEILAQDPRPAYQNDPARIYGMRFADFELHFRVSDGVLQLLALDAAEG